MHLTGWSTWSFRSIVPAEESIAAGCSSEMGSGVLNKNSSIEQIVAEVRRINHAIGQITGGLNYVYGQVRTDAQNQSQGMALFHEQLVDVHRKLGILEKEVARLDQSEIGDLKERCRKIEQESVRTDRKWQSVHEQLQKIPELERELRASNQRIAVLERKLTERDISPCSPGPIHSN